MLFTKNEYSNWGQRKSTYTFSAERLLLSAFRSPTCWLYPLKPSGEQEAEDVRQKTYVLIYPDSLYFNICAKRKISLKTYEILQKLTIFHES
jgi:hypothetical protein